MHNETGKSQKSHLSKIHVSFSSRNKFLVLPLKKYPKTDIKVFWFCLSWLDFFIIFFFQNILHRIAYSLWLHTHHWYRLPSRLQYLMLRRQTSAIIVIIINRKKMATKLDESIMDHGNMLKMNLRHSDSAKNF